MAPPRKKRRAPGEGHPVHLRLPSDVFEWVEKRAEDERRPLNRIIINALAAVPALEQQRRLALLISEWELTAARYAARVVESDLKDELLRAVDAVLEAKDSELTSRVERLRVVRAGMLKAK